MAKKPEPPTLFWLTYRHPDGRAAGVVVIESRGLVHARLVASLAGADRGLEFVSGHKLDEESAIAYPTARCYGRENQLLQMKRLKNASAAMARPAVNQPSQPIVKTRSRPRRWTQSARRI
jgi:hypothetical protein